MALLAGGLGKGRNGGWAVMHLHESRGGRERTGAGRRRKIWAQAVAKGSGLEKRVSPVAHASDDQLCDDREVGS